MERWVDEIEDWNPRRVSDGYVGLHDLADEGFSGAASAGGTWAFLVNGRVVGVYQHRQTAAGSEISPADIERFEDAAITAYEAPHAALPLLISMQAADGETRGRYYTGNTPLSEVHETLSGGFTGYVELSENVLSGDYYTVYQGGRSSHLAFIGNARRLLTDDEARERAEDEVGIYEVVSVDIDVTSIPEVEESATAVGVVDTDADPVDSVASGVDDESEAETDDVTASTDTEGEDVTASTEAEADEPAPSESPSEPAEEPAEAAADESSVAEDTTEDDSVDDVSAEEDSVEEESVEADSGNEESADESSIDEAAEDDTEEPADTSSEPDTTVASVSESESESESDERASEASTGRDPEPVTTPSSAPSTNAPSDPAAAAGALATHAIPSLDPERSGTGSEESSSTSPGTAAVAGQQRPPQKRQPRPDPSELEAARTELEEAQAELERTRSEAEATQAELASAERDLETTREELSQVKAERDELAQRVEELEAQLERLEAAGAAIATEGPALSRAEALAGTNLFIRYGSKGKATLEKAHDGKADSEALAENLALEHHTQFEDEGATVDGRPFDEWLAESQEFRFARWLVTELLFEIRETRSVEGMRDLYDALPKVDRIQFGGSIAFRDEEEGEREVRYDCVARDRMGEPLIVANLQAGRDPVTESSMASLVTNTEAVATAEPTVASGMLVTASFFEPGALETAQQATSGSLLSRDKRQSYVKLSRKRGFHLCLVESRDETFHLSVPDL